MFNRRGCITLAKIFNVPWDATNGRVGGPWTQEHSGKERQGWMQDNFQRDEMKLRQALNQFVPVEGKKRLTKLPGAEFDSDLPADPITRLFFQTKGNQALYQGEYESPTRTDPDRVMLERRDTHLPEKTFEQIFTPLTDMCMRVLDGCQSRKRFVVVPSTFETKGVAKVMFDHGFVAGFRDFHNDRAFAIELKYFQNEPVVSVMEPASRDKKVEFEWSPHKVRTLGSTSGRSSHIQLFILRTGDGRIIDNLQARKEGIGGRGLCMVN